MIKKAILKLIEVYRIIRVFISPVPRCRFVPTCSEYMCQAIEKYGVFIGCYLGFRRLLKCHPFRRGGYDPL